MDYACFNGRNLIACGFEDSIKVIEVTGSVSEISSNQVFTNELTDNASCVKFMNNPNVATELLLLTAQFDSQIIIDRIDV